MRISGGRGGHVGGGGVGRRDGGGWWPCLGAWVFVVRLVVR
jgi:hypothetical protein